eukprot:GHVS01094948.1.p1 GENE.GHVS01094948.1~~GHVS01094948.1.p1  ORF type:complete len:111 (-),score=28.07 GHVS01094948.1:27-359(-)
MSTPQGSAGAYTPRRSAADDYHLTRLSNPQPPLHYSMPTTAAEEYSPTTTNAQANSSSFHAAAAAPSSKGPIHQSNKRRAGELCVTCLSVTGTAIARGTLRSIYALAEFQ